MAEERRDDEADPGCHAGGSLDADDSSRKPVSSGARGTRVLHA
jgi:hypothetical protein